MRIVEVKEIANFYKPTKYDEIINEFINSDMKVCEIVDFQCKKSYVCTQGVHKALIRMHVNNIKAITRDDHVYLVKESMREQSD